MNARILQSTGSWYKVLLDNGDVLNARISGKLRMDEAIKATNPVAVGDWVQIEIEQNDEITAYITGLFPRDNYIVRESPRKKRHRHVLAANMDQAILVTTIKSPNIKLGFIDRFLVSCEAYHIPAVVLLNKIDLVIKRRDLVKLENVKALYEPLGYSVITASAQTGEGITALNDLLQDKVTLLSGHSGVGKSTLINSIQPSLNLKTGVLSGYTGKGIHTTTFATMYPLDFGGFIIDTPGIKELALIDIPPAEISHYFPEMRSRLEGCRFHNCLHINEPGCAVIDALQKGEIADTRYDNYYSILEELKQVKAWDH